MEALRFAICFSAVCSLDNGECHEILQIDKHTAISRLHLEIEGMLSSALLQMIKVTFVL